MIKITTVDRLSVKRLNQFAIVGAGILALCPVGYLLYELVVYSRAGFPTSSFATIVAGAATLRIGLALLMVGWDRHLRAAALVQAVLAMLAGAAAVVLLLASGQLGLRILAVATATFTTNPSEAITTILLRTVTIALFEAAIFAVGWYALLANLIAFQARVLPRPLALLGLALRVLHVVDTKLPDALRLIAPCWCGPDAVSVAGTSMARRCRCAKACAGRTIN